MGYGRNFIVKSLTATRRLAMGIARDTGQYNTKGYDTITDGIELLVGSAS